MPEPRGLEGLIEHLREHGFAVGVDHYLRVGQLLQRIDHGLPLEAISTLLAPIFARSAEEQTRFYEVFRVYVQQGATENDPRSREQVTEQSGGAILAPRISQRQVIAVAVCAAMAIGLIWWISENHSSSPKRVEVTTTIPAPPLTKSGVAQPVVSSSAAVHSKPTNDETSTQTTTRRPASAREPSKPQQSPSQRRNTIALILATPLVVGTLSATVVILGADFLLGLRRRR